ncbi:MAG: helix-turn-helix transcriptional regulator [Gammaproteobacteria bacterium]
MKRRPIQERIGEAIRNRRKAGKFSQEDFADHIDMNRGYYGELERGKKDLRISTLERVGAGLGVSLRDLVGDAESL